jgi:predicted CopG family antitoxin
MRQIKVSDDVYNFLNDKKGTKTFSDFIYVMITNFQHLDNRAEVDAAIRDIRERVTILESGRPLVDYGRPEQETTQCNVLFQKASEMKTRTREEEIKLILAIPCVGGRTEDCECKKGGYLPCVFEKCVECQKQGFNFYH